MSHMYCNEAPCKKLRMIWASKTVFVPPPSTDCAWSRAAYDSASLAMRGRFMKSDVSLARNWLYSSIKMSWSLKLTSI